MEKSTIMFDFLKENTNKFEVKTDILFSENHRTTFLIGQECIDPFGNLIN